MNDLQDSILQAERLLRYASAKGLSIPAELIAEIVNAKELIGKDDKLSSTFEQQKKFWEALSRLTVITTPATIESMRFTTEQQAGPLSRLWAKLTGTVAQPGGMGELAVNKAGTMALMALVVVGFMQLYADIGGTTIQEYQANQLRYDINSRLQAAASLPASASATQTLTRDEVTRKAEMTMVLDKTVRQVTVMSVWLFWMPFKYPADTPEHAQEVLAATEGILTVLRGFLLPIGWGFLGAALYVSRALAEDIRTMAYARGQETLHRSRYYMGAVAGFIVAKFSITLAGSAADDVVHPFVLALLVGYSVEVLFSLLDKLIATFSTK